MNDEIRLQRRARLMDNQVYQSMQSLTRYMDRFYLDAVIGLIPGWGDAVAYSAWCRSFISPCVSSRAFH